MGIPGLAGPPLTGPHVTKLGGLGRPPHNHGNGIWMVGMKTPGLNAGQGFAGGSQVGSVKEFKVIV